MPRALVITTAGTNCDHELAWAFQLAGAEVDCVHLNRLIAKPSLISRYDMIGLPGGFSFGDAIAAGRIFATLIRQHLYLPLIDAVQRGVPIIAPCNGFQVALQIGLLPGPGLGGEWPKTPAVPVCSLRNNASGRFVDRWASIEVPADTRCVWTSGMTHDGDAAMLPVAHAEGQFTVCSDSQLSQLEDAGQIAIRYTSADNPNGSIGDVAGICDASGLVFGLMPHPERYTRWTQHPWWTSLDASTKSQEPLGFVMFQNAMAHARQVTA